MAPVLNVKGTTMKKIDIGDEVLIKATVTRVTATDQADPTLISVRLAAWPPSLSVTVQPEAIHTVLERRTPGGHRVVDVKDTISRLRRRQDALVRSAFDGIPAFANEYEQTILQRGIDDLTNELRAIGVTP